MLRLHLPAWLVPARRMLLVALALGAFILLARLASGSLHAAPGMRVRCTYQLAGLGLALLTLLPVGSAGRITRSAALLATVWLLALLLAVTVAGGTWRQHVASGLIGLGSVALVLWTARDALALNSLPWQRTASSAASSTTLPPPALGSLKPLIDPEAEPAPLAAHESHKVIRLRDEAIDEQVHGWVRVDFAPGQRVASAHVPFCPPLQMPVDCFVEPVEEGAAIAEAVVGQVLPQGARFDVKLEAPASAPTSAVLEFSAVRQPKE